MKKNNIHSVRLKAYKKTTNSNHNLPIAPNFLKSSFARLWIWQFSVKNRNSHLIFHSDRGSPYASNLFRKLLDENSIVQSMSRKGNPYDNAVSENFFSCLKCESLHLKTFKTSAEANLVFSFDFSVSYFENGTGKKFYKRGKIFSVIMWKKFFGDC